MTLQTSDFIRLGFVLPLFIFHISVTLFIISKILKNKTPYNSTFFKLYVMVSIADIITVIIPFTGMKMLLIDDLKPWFKTNLWYNQINWLLAGFSINNQCILHSAIAINRAWTAFFFMKKSTRLTKIAKNIIWFLPIIPILVLIPRFGANAIYFDGANGEIYPKYENPVIQVYVTTSAMIVIYTTSAISLIFGIITIFRYRFLLKRIENVNQNILFDLRLFIQASFLFIIQILLSGHFIMVTIATITKFPELQQFALIYYNWVNDVYCFVNPVFLLIVSKKIRLDYVYFILRKEENILSVQIASVQKLSPTKLLNPC